MSPELHISTAFQIPSTVSANLSWAGIGMHPAKEQPKTVQVGSKHEKELIDLSDGAAGGSTAQVHDLEVEIKVDVIDTTVSAPSILLLEIAIN